jgi:hypothetical protein
MWGRRLNLSLPRAAKVGVTSMKPLRINLRIVFYKEGDIWAAHCLEFDLLGCGKTKKEALKLLCQAIVTQIEATVKYKNIKNLFSPADGKFFAMFAAGKDVAVGKLEIIPKDYVTIENLDTREYSDSNADLALA